MSLIEENEGDEEGKSWAITKSKDGEVEGKNKKKKHPTYESWLAGSPHNSDEYDTDLEEDVKKGQKSSMYYLKILIVM